MLSPAKSTLRFFYETPLSLRDRSGLKRFISLIFKKERRNLESLIYIFCTDKRLLAINREYLRHDYYTDIISFQLSTEGKPVIGEIYISVPRVKDNAKKLDEAFKREIHRVIFHGALHLCGYQDKSALQKSKMREKEDHYLDLYFKMFHK